MPDLVRPAVPLATMEEAMERVFEELFWMTINSPLVGPCKLPPEMVVALLATKLVTRIPPDWRVLVPVKVSVRAAAALKRKLLVVEPLAGVPSAVTVVLLPPAHVSLV